MSSGPIWSRNYYYYKPHYSVPYWLRHRGPTSYRYHNIFSENLQIKIIFLSYDISESQISTTFGTEFSESAISTMKRRLSKKLFGIGIEGPAFLGGAGFGYGVGLISYSIYHRYHYLRSIMFDRGFLDEEHWNEDYYSKYYKR